MENEDINRRIHVEIVGECWHDFRRKHTKQIEYECSLCGSDNSGATNPDYYNDLNAVAKAEAKVIAEKGRVKYYTELLRSFMAGVTSETNLTALYCAIATAPASVRCVAMLKTREK